MARINEHVFSLHNEEYHLSWYDKPRITKKGVEQKVLPILREYITNENLPIQLVNKNGNSEVPHTLARKILKYFSNHKLDKIVVVNQSSVKKKSLIDMEVRELHQKIIIQEKITFSTVFKVVMICSSEKNDSTFDEFPTINFKAISNNINEFHPDDVIPKSNYTWRKYLEERQEDNNLLMAFELYKRNEYRDLYEKFKKSLYILSAGWGLVNSEFKLPKYNISFSNEVALENKRNQNEMNRYRDYNQLNTNANEDIVFIGSRSYLTLFYSLTYNLPNRKVIFYFGQENNLPKPKVNANSFKFIRFPSSNNRKWHYELAECLVKDFNSF